VLGGALSKLRERVGHVATHVHQPNRVMHTQLPAEEKSAGNGIRRKV
jgi:hypothetical protein